MNKLLLASTIFIFYGCSSESLPKEATNLNGDETHLIDFVEKQGYEIEKHRFETEDGYFLTYHRVRPAAAAVTSEGGRGCPVLLQHGLGVSSAAFLIPDHDALGYVLADAGYDVWLASSRGDRYSHDHQPKHTNNSFLNLGPLEVGALDLAAGLDGVLAVTRRQSVAVVAHCQGVAAVLALAASKPSYQAKLSMVLALAPAVLLGPGHPRLAEGYRLFINDAIKRSSKIINESYNFPPGFEEKYCQKRKPCLQILELFRGTIPTEAWKIIQDFQPSISAGETLEEILQQIQQGPVLKHFDYGPSENIKLYKSEAPPAYDLANVNIPVHIYYSLNDVFITNEDVHVLAAALPNVSLRSINKQHFNHFDFLWSPLAKHLIYDSMKDKLKECPGTYSSFQKLKPVTFYSEKTITNSSKSKVFKASERFISNLVSIYGTQGDVYLQVYAYLSKFPHTEERYRRKNGLDTDILNDNPKQDISNTDIQFIYEKFKTLISYSQYLREHYKIDIKMTEGNIIKIYNFNELWKQVFLMYKCSGKGQAVCDVLGTLVKYRSLLLRPYLEIFSPAELIKRNTDFFKHKLSKIYNNIENEKITDLSSTSVKRAFNRVLHNIVESRLVVIAINDIYSLFEKLSANKKYLYNKFQVLITGNISLGLEIVNYHTLKTIDYSLRNCTYQCEEIGHIMRQLNNYDSLLYNNHIKIDNPKTFIGQNIWSAMIKAVDINNYSLENLWDDLKSETDEDIEAETSDEIILNKIFQDLKRKGNIHLTRDEVDELLYTTKYNKYQQDLLKDKLYNIYNIFKRLTMFEKYISDTYKVTIMEDLFQRISIDGFKDFWEKIFNSPMLCEEECLIIRKYLEPIKELKTLVTSNLVEIDNPENYLNKDISRILTSGTPNSTNNHQNGTSHPLQVDEIINNLERFLFHIRKTYLNTSESIRYNDQDLIEFNSSFGNLNSSKSPNISGSTGIYNDRNTTESFDAEKDLEKGENYINSTSDIEGSNLVNKDISNLGKILNELKETKQFCVGNCKENRNLLKRACKFQKHLIATYIGNYSNQQLFNCDALAMVQAMNSSSESYKYHTNEPQGKLDFIQTNEDLNRHVFRELFQQSKPQSIFYLTENKIKILFDGFEDSDEKRKATTNIMFDIYEALQSLSLLGDYLKSHYDVSVTQTGPSTISTDNFSTLWNHTHDQTTLCDSNCKKINSILKQLYIYKDLFTRDQIIIDDPHNFLSKNDGLLVKKPINHSDCENKANSPLTNIQRFDEALRVLEKYYTHIMSTYNLERSDPLSKDINKIQRLINKIKETKELCSKDCEEINLLNTVCKFQKHLHASYIYLTTPGEPLPTCNYSSDYNASGLDRKENMNGNLDLSNVKEHILTNSHSNIWGNLNHTTVDLTSKENANEKNNDIGGTIEKNNNIETNSESLQTTIEDDTSHIIKRLNKYLINLESTYGLGNSTSVTNDILNINKFLNDINDTKYNNKGPMLNNNTGTVKDSRKDFSQRVKMFLEHLDKTYLNKINVDYTNDSPSSTDSKLAAASKVGLVKLFQSSDKSQYINLTSKRVRKLLLNNDTNKEVYVSTLIELYDALEKLSAFSAYISSVYNARIVLEENLKMRIEHINNFWNKVNSTDYMCNETCHEVQAILKVIYKYKDYLTSNLVEIENPATYLSKNSADLLKQEDTESGKNKTDEPHSNTDLWNLFRTYNNTKGTDLSAAAVQEVLSQLSTNHSENKNYISAVLDIYDVFKTLVDYKTFLKENYNVIISNNDRYDIEISNFEHFLDYLYNTKITCSEKCTDVRRIMDHITKYHSLIKTNVIRIDNPKSYLNTDQFQQHTKTNYTGLNENQPSFVLDTKNKTSIANGINIDSSSVDKIADSGEIVDRLKKYLVHIKSLYIPAVEAVQDDLGNLTELVSRIDNERGKCIGPCHNVQELIKKAQLFQKHVNDTYFTTFEATEPRRNETRTDQRKDLHLSTLLGSKLWFLLGHGNSRSALDLSGKTLQELLNEEGPLSDEKTLLFVDIVHILYNLFSKLESHKHYLMKYYDVHIDKTPQSTITVKNIKNLFSNIYKENPCIDICQEIKNMLKASQVFQEILFENEYTEIGNPQRYFENRTEPVKLMSYESLENQGHLLDNKLLNMYSVHDAINILEGYALKIKNTETISSLPQHNLDNHKLKTFLDELNRVKMQKYNTKAIGKLLKDVNEFQIYLKRAYPLTNRHHFPSNPTPLETNKESIRNISSILWNFINSNENSKVLDLTKESVENDVKVLDKVQKMQTEFTKIIFDIYEVLQKLKIYKDYLRTFYNVVITFSNESGFTVRNFNKLFSILNEETTSCTDQCIQIKSISKKLQAYHDLLNVATLKIDNPAAYLNISLFNTNQHADSKINTNFEDIIIRLRKYLNHIQSTYNIDSVDSKVSTDVHYIKKFLQDIETVTKTCTGNCTEANDLLRKIARFQIHLRQNYIENASNDMEQNANIEDTREAGRKYINSTAMAESEGLHQGSTTIFDGNNHTIQSLDYNGDLLQRVRQYQSNVNSRYNLSSTQL